MILLYMAITIYGSFVLTGVVEEKSSRVVEVLLSRVQPSSLLGGKIAGIGLAGLAQFAAVATAAAVTLLITRPSGLPPGTYAAIPMLVVWFVLGYAFYSMLYGSLGALASRTEDAQAAAGPVIIVLVAIYVAATMAVSSAGSAWVTVLSVLPPSAPIFMPLRTSLADVPAWQVAAAAILTLASVYGLFRIGGRLYRNAVLHTGAVAGVRQVLVLQLPVRRHYRVEHPDAEPASGRRPRRHQGGLWTGCAGTAWIMWCWGRTGSIWALRCACLLNVMGSARCGSTREAGSTGRCCERAWPIS
jgi:ABC-type Na+ efflux pump permease subunit